MGSRLSNNNIRAVSLLSISTLVLYAISALILPVSVKAALASNFTDTMTRLTVNTESSHSLAFTMSPANTFAADETINYDFFTDNFMMLAGLSASDVSFNDGTARTIYNVTYVGTPDCSGSTGTDDIAVDSSTLGIKVEACDNYIASAAGTTVLLQVGTVTGGANFIINPPTSGMHLIGLGGNFGDTGFFNVAMMDSDTVNTTGFLETFLTFDIDTAPTNVDCDAAGGVNPCNSHSGVSDGGGYIVDLGELTTSAVNHSGETNVFHADGNTGDINYVWLDLSTNAASGIVAKVFSTYGVNDTDVGPYYPYPDPNISALEGPDGSEIRSVPEATNTTINPGDGRFGIAFPSGGVNSVATGTAVEIGGLFDQNANGASNYGPILGTSGYSVLMSSTGPVDQSRTQWTIAATPDSQDRTGTYTDELTFMVSATF